MFHISHRDLRKRFPYVFVNLKIAPGKVGIPFEVKMVVCLCLLGTLRALDDLDDGQK